MCAMSKNSYNWDWSESEVKRPKLTPLPHMRLWSNFLCLDFRGNPTNDKNHRLVWGSCMGKSRQIQD